ncbi:MAG: hypothetical protein QMD71_01305 [bacterium]|nr:hypothetical protein [bacterium]
MYSGKGAKEFLRECLKRLPVTTRHIFVRSDSSFYNHEFFRYMDKKGIKYAIAVRLQEWVRRRR